MFYFAWYMYDQVFSVLSESFLVGLGGSYGEAKIESESVTYKVKHLIPLYYLWHRIKLLPTQANLLRNWLALLKFQPQLRECRPCSRL